MVKYTRKKRHQGRKSRRIHINALKFRSLITEKKFLDYLAANKIKKSDASCGWHKNFVLKQLGYVEDFPTEPPKFNITKYHPLDYLGTGEGALTVAEIPDVMKELEKGAPIVFYHDYNDYMGKTYHSQPKSNRYGNHVFVITKVGTKYFVTQGYLHRYKHKVDVYERKEIEHMLKTIIEDLSDYSRKKTWADIDFDAYKKYFGTELTAYPDIPLKKTNKVKGINLVYVKTKREKVAA